MTGQPQHPLREAAQPPQGDVRHAADASTDALEQLLALAQELAAEETAPPRETLDAACAELRRQQAELAAARAELAAERRRLQELRDASQAGGADALWKANRLIDLLLSHSPAGIYTCAATPPFAATFVSANVVAILGYTPEEFLADPEFWWEHVHPDDRERVVAQRQRLSVHGRQTHEYRFWHRDGGWRWLRDDVSLLAGADGRPVELSGHFLDVTAQKSADQALQEWEATLRLALDVGGLLSWSWSPDSDEIVCSHDYWKFHGGRETGACAVPADRALEAVHEADRPRLVQAFERCLATGEDLAVEYRGAAVGPRPRWFLSRAKRMSDAAGKVPRVVGVTTNITEQKQAELELRETTRLLDDVLQNTHMMAAYLDAEFNFVWVNPAYAAASRRDPDYFRGKNHFELFPHAENRAIFQRVVETGEPFFAAAKPFNHPDQPERGATFWDWSLSPTRDANGRVTGLVFTLADVTDRIHAELEVLRLNENLEQLVTARTGELRENEERTRQIIDTAMDAVVTMDIEGRISGWNPQAEIIFGWTAAEAIGRPLAQTIVPPALREAHELGFERYLQSGASRILHRRLELTAMRRDGGEFPVELTVVPVTIKGAPQFSAFIRDITERRRAEAALRDSEERFRLIWESAADGMRLTDAEGRIVAVNEAFCRLMGKPRREIEGRPLSDVYAEPERSRILARYRERFGRVEVEPRLVRQITLWDGRDLWLEVSNCIITTDPERPLLLSVIRDITERKQAAEQMESLRDQLAHVARLVTLGEMASGLAHELNQPLAALQLYASAAEQLGQTLEAPALTDCLRRISEQTLRAGAIVRNMRSFVSPTPAQCAPADLHQLIRHVLLMLENELRLAGVSLKLEFDERLPAVPVDGVQIQQVLVNLIRNALDAMASVAGAHCLAIQTEAGDGWARVRVVDDGCGVAPAMAAHLFTPFQTTKSTGLGLGLAISRTLIEAHGGRIGALPNADRGTTFYFQLPYGAATGGA